MELFLGENQLSQTIEIYANYIRAAQKGLVKLINLSPSTAEAL